MARVLVSTVAVAPGAGVACGVVEDTSVVNCCYAGLSPVVFLSKCSLKTVPQVDETRMPIIGAQPDATDFSMTMGFWSLLRNASRLHQGACTGASERR